MLQYPTNVSPENTAKPADSTRMSFTFNGDRLSYYKICATKLSTGYRYGLYSYSEDEGNRLPVYNGEEVAMAGNAPYLENGEDYVWQVLLAQRDLSGENPLYDIPVCRGSIKGVGVSDTTQIYIDKNLSLYEWGYSDGAYRPTLDEGDNVLVGMVLEINGERKLITSYKNVAYGTDGAGLAVVESSFADTPTVGDRYQIYANYLISPQYYFMSRATPSLTLTLDWLRDSDDKINSAFSLRVVGEYSQAQSSSIKYYTATLYAFSGDDETSTQAELYKVAESDKIFSQRIDYTFENCLVGINPWNNEDITNVNYRAIVELVTQDNVTYAAYASMRIEGIDDTAPVAVDYTWLPINLYGCNVSRNLGAATVTGKTLCYRTDLDTQETVMLPEAERIYDFKVSTKGNYRYTTVFYDSTTGQPYIKSTKHYDVTTNFDGYFITALIPKGEKSYDIGDTWKFICDIENTTVVQNLDVVSQIGYAPYPSVSSTELNYMSGTLSGYIGYFNCCEHEYKDDIAVVKAWREFISQPHPFLLKSQKGDVWMVNIVESPKVEYQEDYYKIPTRFTFSWAECGNVNNYLMIRDANNVLDVDKIRCSSGAPTDKDWYEVTTEEDYIYYTFNQQAIVVRYIGDSKQPIIPETMGGFPVTTICATAFYHCRIDRVWLPSTVRIIE